ncbi:MAG: hypothetical protein HY670_01370 [Chloroflexi bacterium]|nr:hypothetical protein [Chloroflexota bacterium]
MNKELLTARLKPQHRKAGLYLEDDDHFVYLKQGDDVLVVWNAGGVTMRAILTEADRRIPADKGVLPPTLET